MIEVEITKMTEVVGEFQTYNINNVEGNNNYFANGILVHNKVTPEVPTSFRRIYLRKGKAGRAKKS